MGKLKEATGKAFQEPLKTLLPMQSNKEIGWILKGSRRADDRKKPP